MVDQILEGFETDLKYIKNLLACERITQEEFDAWLSYISTRLYEHLHAPELNNTQNIKGTK